MRWANEHAKVGIIGISNNFKFRESLSPRVKSTLTEREIQFSPYDANELRTILNYYADLVFYENVLSDDVVPLCAAFTAKTRVMHEWDLIFWKLLAT